jgi:hypothetical protein
MRMLKILPFGVEVGCQGWGYISLPIVTAQRNGMFDLVLSAIWVSRTAPRTGGCSTDQGAYAGTPGREVALQLVRLYCFFDIVYNSFGSVIGSSSNSFSRS